MKRALISVYDKTGIVEFSLQLEALGWEIISTGGTKDVLRAAGIKVIDIEQVTKFPEILDGRVKTLNPLIHGGLLYKRDNLNHIKTINDLNIDAIDMVVNNLYPFEETINKPYADHNEIIENIDIGGPSMIRAAAKNYRDVTVIVDPDDYHKIISELDLYNNTSLKTREYLACKVFNYTAYYDALISKYFNNLQDNYFPDMITFPLKKQQGLRYGENPHQKGAFYKEAQNLEGTMADFNQLHGKELSFNNINDANGALKILKEFNDPTAIALKHANPCGIGSGATLIEAYEKAYESDKESIFGGIIALNREVDELVASKVNDIFIEIVIAPSYSKKALEILTGKKNIRILAIENIMKNDYKELDVKKVLGGLLVQERDNIVLLDEIKVVSHRLPTDEEMEDMMFAFKATKHINSNGVVLAKNKATIGIGLGEVNRFWAVEKSIERGKDKVAGSVLASDGFFPFTDSIELLAKAGVTAIIQPGGSIKDNEIINVANKHNITMIFTSVRHFKH